MNASSFDKRWLAGLLVLSLLASAEQPAVAALGRMAASEPSQAPALSLPAQAALPPLPSSMVAPEFVPASAVPVAARSAPAQAPSAAPQSAAPTLGTLNVRLAQPQVKSSALAVRAFLDSVFFGAKRRLSVAVLGAALLATPNLAAAHVSLAARTAPRAAAAAQVLAASAPKASAFTAADLDVKVSVDPKPHPLADPIQVTVTVANGSSQVETIQAEDLKAAIAKAVGPGFDVSLEKDGEIAVAAGAQLPIAVELNANRIPDGLKQGGTIDFKVPPAAIVAGDQALIVPGFTVKMMSALKAGQKAEFQDVHPWGKYFWDLLRLGLWAAGLAAAYGSWRLFKEGARSAKAAWEVWRARRATPRELALKALAGLDSDLRKGMEPVEFYRRLVVALNLYLGSRFDSALLETSGDLTDESATLRSLISEVAGRKGLPEADLGLLRGINAHAEQVLYAQSGVSADSMRRDLDAARGLVGRLEAPPEQKSGLAGKAGALALLPALPPVVFQHPAWLALLVPLAGYMIWHWSRPRAAQFAVPSGDWIPKKKSWRQRLRWLPQAVLALALAVNITALADPAWGFHRGDRLVTSLDNVFVVDHSGSMREGLPGSGSSKMDAAKQAAERLIDDQKGTTNRVGLIVFTDQPHLVLNLTLDYDALDAAFSQVQADGGTDVGKALDAALSHFLENNIVDADTSRYPAADHVRETLKTKGLAAALQEARQTPGFLDALLAKDHNRVIIFLTDGADGGRTVDESIARARDLGIKIFAISVPSGDQSTLQKMADQTGGRFFDVQDQDGLNQAFAEIEKMEKAMIKIKSPPRPVHHDWEFAQKAWLLVILSLLLGAEPFRLSVINGRRLSAFILPMALLSGLLGAPQAPAPAPHSPAAQTAAQKVKQAVKDNVTVDKASPYREIPEIEAANKAYQAGDYDGALKLYQQAAEKHPDMPELQLYKGMAQAKKGDTGAAKAALDKAMKMALDQHRSDILASAEVEQGNVAQQSGDTKGALGYWRDSQRVKPDGTGDKRLSEAQQAARNNYETALRQQQSQRPQGGGQKKDGQQNPQDQNQNGQQGGQDKQQDQQKAGQQQQQQQQQQQPKDGQNGKDDKSDTNNQAKKALKDLEHNLRGNVRDGSRSGKFWGLTAFAAPALTGFLAKAWHWLLAQLPSVGGHTGLAWRAPHFLVMTAVAVLVLGVLAVRSVRAQYKPASALAGKDQAKSFWTWRPGRAWLRKTAVTLAGLVLLGLGSANPVVSSRQESFSFGGEDVAILQDVSPSVRWSEDGRYNEATKGLERFIHWLENGSGSDRIAVVPFSGTGGEAVLSDDYKSAVFALYHMAQDGDYLQSGTSLSQGVQQAIQVFTSAKDIGARKKVLIILSDGGDPGDESDAQLAAAAKMAKSAGITVYTVGIGSSKGARMIDPDSPAGQPKYVTDGSGQVVYTQLNEHALRVLEENAGGAYYPAQGGSGVDQALGAIAAREKGNQTEVMPVENGISRLFLLPGAALLLLGLMTGNGIKEKKKEKTRDEEPKGKAALNALALGLPLSLSLGASSGLMPVIVGGAAVAFLLLVAAVFLLPTRLPLSKEEEIEQQGARFARIQQAANRMYMEKILRGEFASPEPARSGADPDDSVPYTNEAWRLIDHKASARGGKLYARRFEEDPDIPMMILVDLSKSAEFGSQKASKRDVIADAAAAVALAAAREDMPVGAVIFTDRIEKFIPPRTGLGNAKNLARELMDFKPSGTKTDLAMPLREALQRLSKRGVVTVVSDFNDGKSDWASPLQAAGHKHVVVPIVVEDALERKPLGDLGLVDVQDAETGARGLLDTRSKQVRNSIFKQMQDRRSRIRSSLRSSGARPLFLSNDADYLNRLVGYFQSGGRNNEDH